MSSFLKVFAFCMLAGWAYSVAIPADSIAEYCAEIVDDSTYIPVLVKDLNIPVVDWNSVFETYGNGRVKPLEQSYSSVLVGECVKNGNSAKMTK